MSPLRTAASTIAAVLLAAALGTGSAVAAPAVNGAFPVSALESNNKIIEGPDGNVWVTLSGAGKNVARINPQSGEVKEFELGINGPSGIARGPEGRLWITRANGLTSFQPENPEGSKESAEIADIVGNSPIVFGPDGNFWVAVNEKLLRIPPLKLGALQATDVKEFAVAELSPRDIDVAGTQLVVADFGAKNRILTVTTAGVTTDHSLIGGSQGVAGAPSGQIAFSQDAEPEQIGLLTPPGSPLLTNVPMTDPFGIAFGADGAFWVAQSFGGVPFGEPNFGAVKRVTTDNQITTLRGFPENGRPRQIAAGPGNTMWVTLEGVNEVARISGLEPPPVTETPPPPEPQTKITKGPRHIVKTRSRRAGVKFTFSSPDAGASFQCRMIRIAAKGKRSKAPSFAACKSPKAYRLKPGRYRFEVRAVVAGVVDKSPASRSFRVVHVGRHRHR